MRGASKRINAMQRQLYDITGADRLDFLQGLVSNQVPQSGLCYAALLSPQGKYLADFFLLVQPDRIVLDAPASLADGLIRRLAMYKLRADVQIAPSELQVQRGTANAPAGALPDPRDPAMGWRLYSDAPAPHDDTDWDALRVAHLIPEAGAELIPDESYILEHGFERLNGVDFRKGCYVGQEVTARMKHKTELRKGLARVQITGSAPKGTPITADGKPVGYLGTQSGDHAIAYLRFDRATGQMQAGDATLSLSDAG